MARTSRRLLYVSPEIDAAIKERAELRGVSVNEWINLALKHALSGERAVGITETHTITTKREI